MASKSGDLSAQLVEEILCGTGHDDFGIRPTHTDESGCHGSQIDHMLQRVQGKNIIEGFSIKLIHMSAYRARGPQRPGYRSGQVVIDVVTGHYRAVPILKELEADPGPAPEVEHPLACYVGSHFLNYDDASPKEPRGKLIPVHIRGDSALVQAAFFACFEKIPKKLGVTGFVFSVYHQIPPRVGKSASRRQTEPWPLALGRRVRSHEYN
jgi:hypothetical protein